MRISEYVTAIELLSRKYSAFIGSGISEQKNIQEQAFSRNLTLETAVYIQSKNSETIEDKIRSLTHLENTIISKKTQKTNIDLRFNNSPNSLTKCCSIHKVRSHATCECRAQKCGSKGDPKEKMTDLNAIHEPQNIASILILKGKINSKTIYILLCTGAALNTVSENIESFFLKKQKIQEKKSIIMPD